MISPEILIGFFVVVGGLACAVGVRMALAIYDDSAGAHWADRAWRAVSYAGAAVIVGAYVAGVVVLISSYAATVRW